MTTYLHVRRPNFQRLACEATPGSRVRVKCMRCGEWFERSLAVANA